MTTSNVARALLARGDRLARLTGDKRQRDDIAHHSNPWPVTWSVAAADRIYRGHEHDRQETARKIPVLLLRPVG